MPRPKDLAQSRNSWIPGRVHAECMEHLGDSACGCIHLVHLRFCIMCRLQAQCRVLIPVHAKQNVHQAGEFHGVVWPGTCNGCLQSPDSSSQMGSHLWCFHHTKRSHASLTFCPRQPDNTIGFAGADVENCRNQVPIGGMCKLDVVLLIAGMRHTAGSLAWDMHCVGCLAAAATVAMADLVRQVEVGCAQRGRSLALAWNLQTACTEAALSESKTCWKHLTYAKVEL